MSDIDLLADAREWLATQGDRVQTHSGECHRWHPACLVARLLRELDSRAGQSGDSDTGESKHAEPSTPGEGTRQGECTLSNAERRALREAAEAYAENDGDADCERIAATLRGLLERIADCDK
jgi:hypothetical protein